MAECGNNVNAIGSAKHLIWLKPHTVRVVEPITEYESTRLIHPQNNKLCIRHDLGSADFESQIVYGHHAITN